MPTVVNFGTKSGGGPNIQAPWGQMTSGGRGLGGGMGYGGMSQFGGMRKRPMLGSDPLIGIGNGWGQPQPPPDYRGHDQPPPLHPPSQYPGVGDRNQPPGWPGDNPIGDGQGDIHPRQLIDYRGLPGFNSFQDSFPPSLIPGRRRIDTDPGQYGQGLRYKDPAMLQGLSNAAMSYRGQGQSRRGGGLGGGQGFGEGYPGDALRRLLMARVGGGF